MPNSSPTQSTSRALAGSALLVLVLVVLIVQFVWQGRHDSVERGQERAQIAAVTVAAHFQWFTEASRQALRRIDDAILAQPDLLESGVIADIDDAIASLPAGVHVRLFDATGRQVLSTRPEDGTLDIVEREYFKVLRDGKEVEISSLLQDRLTSQQGFVIARRITRGGDFRGVAAVLVPETLIAEFWITLDLGPGSATSIFREDGKLVARFPSPDGPIDLRNHVLFTQHLPQAASGSYASPFSPADGVERIVGYSRVKDAPLVAVAAIATDVVLEAFHTRVKRLAIGLMPVIAALTLLAWRVYALHRRDIHQRRNLEQTLNENQLLLREVHHRVKNNLQTIASLIQLQEMDPSTKRDLRARIAAMAGVHEHLYSGGRLGEINAAEYLQQVVEGVKASFGRDVGFDLAVDQLKLQPDQALALGLIVTELLSNSLKHSFSDRSGDEISLTLTHDGADTGKLHVTDNGRPFDPAANHKGIGLKLLKGFANQLHARYTLDGKNGLAFHMTFPLVDPYADHRPGFDRQRSSASKSDLARASALPRN
jgi:two-component system, sensor histidine kinase PdtaS